MNWVQFNKQHLPPENVDLVVRLTTGLKAFGRNMNGCFHQYHAGTDRFVEVIIRPNDPWYSVTHYVVINDPV